jgi:hypothetical protein
VNSLCSFVQLTCSTPCSLCILSRLNPIECTNYVPDAVDGYLGYKNWIPKC